MYTVLILFGIAGLVWLLAMGRHLSVVTGSLLVILIGVTIGHPFFHYNLGPLPLTIDRVLWIALIMASIAMILMGRSQPKPINRTDIVVIALALLLISSTLLHDWRYKDNMPMGRLLFFNLLPMGYYFVARHCEIKTEHLKVFYLVLTVFGVYLAATAIFEQRQMYALVFPRYILDPEHWEFLGRARGPLLNPVSCGIYLIFCMVATAFLWVRAHPFARVILSLVIVLCVGASFLTLTRSVWLSCAVAIGMLCWFPFRAHVRGTMIVVGTLLLVFASLTISSERLNRFQRDKDVSEAAMAESVTLRPMLAHVALRMAEDKPFFGHGFGQYTASKKPYHYAETEGMQLSRVLPYMQHNVFLSYLTETGFAGLFLLVVLLGILAFKSWQLWRMRLLPLPERQFGLLGLALVACYCLNGMFHDVSIIPHVGAIFYLTLGITDNLYASKISPAIAGRMDLETEEQDWLMAA